jgi:hypothetical protein
VNREEQRRKAVLVDSLSRAIKTGESTLPFTTHLDEIAMTTLEQDGHEVFRDYSAAERRRMARDGRALSDGSFPIANCADAADAIHSIGRAAPAKRARAEAHIRKRVRSLSCSGSIFDRWK